MAEINHLSGAAFEAVAAVQATYGVPDRLIAQIAQCSTAQIYNTRKKMGWTLRKISSAFLRGGAAQAGGVAEVKDRAGPTGDVDCDALIQAMDRLLWRMTQEMAVVDLEDLDELALKRIETISTSAKQMDRLIEQRGKLLQGLMNSAGGPSQDPEETAKALKKIEKRVHELAEQRAREIIEERSNQSGNSHDISRMDDQCAPETD